MASSERMLLKGPFPEVTKLKLAELREEVKMWRNVWAWVPDEVKYYVARTGQQIGLTQRNYKRFLGVLLETHWTIDEIELGTMDKVYDYNTGEYFFERKIVKMKVGSLIDVQWIAERTPESEITGEVSEEPPAEQEQPQMEHTEP